MILKIYYQSSIWMKIKIAGVVKFTNGRIVNTKDLDYNLIKPLIW